MLDRKGAVVMLLCACVAMEAGAQSRPVFRESRIAENPGRIPSGVAFGDFNGDGVLDAVTSNSTTGTVTTFLAFDGELLSSTEVAIGNVPMGVVSADFDEDGKPDLVVSNGSDASVSFARGRDGGEFEPREPAIGVGVSPSGLAVADLNRDGNLDVAVATEGLSETAPGAISVLHGDGNGGFTKVADLGTDLGTRAVAIGELDGDGNLDMVAANSRGNCFSLCTGIGDGRRFNCLTCVPTGVEPLGIAIGDFDADGDNDVATADKNADAVSVYTNDGRGAFAARRELAVGTFPGALGIGDFDGDGNLDIAAANSLSGDVSLLRGFGNGQFAPARHFVADGQPTALVVADLDDDGRDDVLTANVAGNDGSLASFRAREGGVLHAVEDVVAGSGPNALACGDYDQDGAADLVATHGDGTVRGFSALADGSFAPPVTLHGGTSARGLVLRDVNRDGILDLAVLDKDRNKLQLRLGRSTGGFADAQVYDTAVNPAGIATGDFNRDGRTDLAVTAFGPPGQVLLYFGRGATPRNYTVERSAGTIAVGETPVGIEAADLDGASGDDLVVVNEASNNVSILKNRGDATFEVTETLTGGGPRGLVVARLDGDDIFDIAIGNTVAVTQPGIVIYAGAGDGTVRRPPTNIRTERVDALVARDFTGDRCYDLMAVDQTSNSSRLFRGNCMGRYTLDRESNANLSRMPVALAAGDFDSNGLYDGASANSQMTANNLSVLWNCSGEEGCSPLPAEQQPAVRGEANDDGGVSAADLVQIVREIGDGDGSAVEDSGRETPVAAFGADANGDGRIDAMDPVAAAHRIFAGG